ncbi:MAG: inverse autotransporter beta domain-containing protein, partial [Providencia heimbachae]|nr:inverse autotransporter beta domain-containing protein [Providencia heimbachae]
MVNTDMMNTMNGIQALVDDNGSLSQSTSSSLKAGPSSSVNLPPSTSTLPDFSVGTNTNSFPPVVHDNTVRQDDILSALPTLGLPDTVDEPRATPETLVAQGASQAGQMLSNGDAVDASVGYARSLGENLVNQQITDWLNQYGKARVQLSTDKTGEADLLLPIIDKANSLLFSQVGIRANEDRNTTNVGLGYRQYQDDWMWGLNSFYDYDITGGNSRVGVGSELWFDYLKFAGNGYFRLTDWHQSDLHDMRDYDERPANGFDLRAEGYLPSYPQLGAFAKYEQYFGDGISLSDSGVSVSDLKNDPSRSTLGVSYTPFPLMTLKGETSRGDSNDSRLGLELTYRFGVPLNQQLNPEYVDLMRSLAGNRY